MTDTVTRSVWTMNEITISVTYPRDDDTCMMEQISRARESHIPSMMKITEINWEREYLNAKSRVTFRGVQK